MTDEKEALTVRGLIDALGALPEEARDHVVYMEGCDCYTTAHSIEVFDWKEDHEEGGRGIVGISNTDRH